VPFHQTIFVHFRKLLGKKTLAQIPESPIVLAFIVLIIERKKPEFGMARILAGS
jgi:hypothetical protein